MTTASYFDGSSARMHPVDVDLTDGAIALAGGAVAKTYSYAQARLAEPFANADCVVEFADGARCEFSDPQARETLAARLGYRKSRLARLEQRWPAALLSLALLAGCAFSAVTWGLPYVADRVVASMPASADQRAGDQALKALHAQVFEPSRLSRERQAELQGIFNSVKPGKARMPLTLLLVTTDAETPNVLSMPNGTIVMTDEMVHDILARDTELSDSKRAALAGIFAHEIGHIEGRHAMRAIAHSSLQALGAAMLFGDFSGVVHRSPALVLNMDYSRQMETAADGYAIARMDQAALPVRPLADLLDSLDKLAPGESELPRWMNDNQSYLRSHPASAARSARLRNAGTKYGN